MQPQPQSPDPAPGEPTERYAGPPPYEDYVHATLLNHLQKPLSDAPAELGFLITTQVMELWFTLIVSEWRTAQAELRRDRLRPAMEAIRRSLDAHRALNDSWRPLAALTPAQFNGFRSVLGTASGVQSAMYRQLEFLLGERSRSLMRPHRKHPEVYADLEQALTAPSLYDDVLAHLARRGFDIPAEQLTRELTEPYRAHPGVEEVWRQIYAGDEEAPPARLAELLTDLAETVQRWRHDHLLAVRRAMGDKPGSAGSAGTAWLEKRAARPVFPELWSARTHV